MQLTFIDRTCSAYFIARNMSWISNGNSFLRRKKRRRRRNEWKEWSNRIVPLIRLKCYVFEVKTQRRPSLTISVDVKLRQSLIRLLNYYSASRLRVIHLFCHKNLIAFSVHILNRMNNWNKAAAHLLYVWVRFIENEYRAVFSKMFGEYFNRSTFLMFGRIYTTTVCDNLHNAFTFIDTTGTWTIVWWVDALI